MTVRKNLITIRARFPPSGYSWPRGQEGYSTVPPEFPPTFTPWVQPSAAQAVLGFTNPQGVKVTTTLAMALGADGVTWSCLWDSSAAGRGLVTWVVFASGTVQAANQGQFEIEANYVNTF